MTQVNDARCESAVEFGSRLRLLRGRLTQATVARRSVLGQVALTRQRISTIENGQLPSSDQLRCYLHGCGSLELFDALDAQRGLLEPEGGAELEPVIPGPPLWGRFLLVGVVSALVAVLATVGAVEGLGYVRPQKLIVPECSPGSICFWPEPDYEGTKVQLDPDWIGDGRQCLRLPFVARSEMNNSAERHWGYADPGCTGDFRTLLQNSGSTNREVRIGAYTHT
ncbi:hypothetical protein D5S17_23135 [Pseudonocardiaceae bacterium YIM PH 21723]|nr:hypothetical protein D5S17_23135 [Pseudonocardiaceae bacterium YIM PH 21723]